METQGAAPKAVPKTALAIEVRDIVIGFGEQIVIDHLSLGVRSGEILGLVGASGGGKSVLLRSMIGLIPKREGRVEILGVDLDRSSEDAARAIERRCGILFQSGALFSSLTLRENIAFPLRENLGVSEALIEEIANAKLEIVGLDADDGDKFPAELSGGMVKRAALARALSLDPEILFLDEPTSGLDPISASAFDALIKALQETLGLTVFMATHDLDSLNAVCDRIAALDEGKIVALGPMATMLASDNPWVRAYFGGSRARTPALALEKEK